MRASIQQVPVGEILDLLGNTLDAQVAYVGADLRYRFANDAYHAWQAKPSVSLRGKAMPEVLGAKAYEAIKPVVDLALGGEGSELEITRRHPSSGLRTIIARLIPDLQPDGSVNGFLEILRDVTEGRRRQAEDKVKNAERQQIDAAIASSERRFRTMVDQSPLSTQIFDQYGKCIHANLAWERLWETPLEQLGEYNILSDPQMEELALTVALRRAFEGQVVEIPDFCFDPVQSGLSGRSRWVRALLYPIQTDEDQQEIVLVLADVTAEKRAQEELEATKERLQLIVNTSQDAVITIDVRDKITAWDGQSAQIFGWTRADAIGLKLSELILPPDESPVKGVHSLLQDSAGNGRFEMEAVHKNGHRFPVEIAISAARQGDEAFFSVFIRDISERRAAQAELHELNALLEQKVVARTEELVKANRELEAFSYAVAHDLRNPLRRLAAVTSIIQMDFEDVLDQSGQAQLEEIKGFVRDMSQLIEDHLHFARFSRSEFHPQKLEFAKLCWSVVRDVEKRYPRVQVRVRILPTLRVTADERLLQVILDNLLDNAAKFSQKSDNPLVEIGTALKGQKRVIYVRDNGVGFDPAFAHKLFQPFERLHREEDFGGTGVGLANVKRLLERHGGEIWAESAEGKGAVFYFTLSQ